MSLGVFSSASREVLSSCKCSVASERNISLYSSSSMAMSSLLVIGHRPGPPLGKADQRACDLRQGKDLVRHDGLKGGLGHAKDRAGGLVLDDGRACCGFELGHAFCTISPHSSEDDADAAAARVGSQGSKEHVDRRADAVDTRSLMEVDLEERRLVGEWANLHVPIPRSDED